MQIQITKEEYKEQAELLYERVAASEYCKGVNDGKMIAVKKMVEIIEGKREESEHLMIKEVLLGLKADIVKEAIA